MVEMKRGEDWKGQQKLKKVNIYINLDGVTVTKMQTKKKVSDLNHILQCRQSERRWCTGPKGGLMGLVPYQKLGCFEG